MTVIHSRLTLLLGLVASPAMAQYNVNPVEDVGCFAVSDDGQFVPDSVARVHLVLTGGDSLVLTWDPAIVIGAIGMEEDGGRDIWWVEGSLQPPITVGSNPPGAQDSEVFRGSTLPAGARLRVFVMDAADEHEATWACARLYVVEG